MTAARMLPSGNAMTSAFVTKGNERPERRYVPLLALLVGAGPLGARLKRPLPPESPDCDLDGGEL